MNENSKDQQPQAPPQGYPPPPYYYPPPYEEDEINLLDLWRVLWNHKWLIACITFLSTGIAVFLALTATPIYRSEVLMAPVTEKQSSNLSNLAGQFGGLAALAGVNFGGGGGSKDEAIAFLKSRALTEKFIKDENLLPVFFSENWDAENKTWNVEKQEDTPTMWDAYKVFNKGIRKVAEDRKTGLVTLAIEWKDPKLASDWAAKMVKRVNKYMRERAVHDAENNLKYLKTALTRTSSVEVQEAIYRIIESQIKTIMVAKSRQEYSFRVIDPAVVPEERIKPKRRQMVTLGFIIGLFLGVFIAFGRNYIRQNSQKVSPS